MKRFRRRPWTTLDILLLSSVMMLAIWLLRQPLLDIIAIGLRDEEQSHIFLAPLVAGWLLWLRRSRLQYVMVRPSLIGVGVVALGWVMSWWGFQNGVQIAWHGGALLTLLGVLLSFTDVLPIRLMLPVFAVLPFMLPIPGVIRHQIAYPMQQLATEVTYGMLELMGVGAVKSGNVLVINGEQVAVGEACNGMRMVFALVLVVYAFAFGSPLKPLTRTTLLVLSPLVALICNVIRLVPTSLIYGYGDPDLAQRFHDMAGWVMLLVAFGMLAGVLRLIRWLEFPVNTYRLANQ